MSCPEDHTILKHLFHTEKWDIVSKEDLTKLKIPHISLLETDSLHCCVLPQRLHPKADTIDTAAITRPRLFIKLAFSLLLMDLSALLLITLLWSHNQVSFAKGSAFSITALKEVSGRYFDVTPKCPFRNKALLPQPDVGGAAGRQSSAPNRRKPPCPPSYPLPRAARI